MISISANLHLENIAISDQNSLMGLMQKIYPPAYKHLWVNEDCNWYLNHCFSEENLKNELSEANAIYCFVIHNLKRVGIVRYLYNTNTNEIAKKNATFIHRIYLSNEVQGKGIAKQLFDWVEKQAIQKQDKLLWLKAMDTQLQALKFYEKQGFKTIEKISLDFNLIHQHLRGMVVMTKALNNKI